MNGLGPLAPPSADGLRRTVFPVFCQWGSSDAEVLFAGSAPRYAGLYQLNVRVPSAPGGADGKRRSSAPPGSGELTCRQMVAANMVIPIGPQ
jgi:hypothetical protein